MTKLVVVRHFLTFINLFIMKKIILIVSSLLFISATYAQELKIGETHKVNIQNEEKIYHPIISEDGSKLLYTSEDYKGLKLYDLATNLTVEINDMQGGGFSPAISYDNKYVYYRVNRVLDKLNNVGVNRYDVDKKNAIEIISPTRADVKIIPQQKKIIVKTDKKVIGNSGKKRAIVSEDYNSIILNQEGKESKLNPVSDAHSYLWVSLSPDGKKILFVEPYKGIFTCDLNGDNLKSYGKGDNPVWLGNSFIVATKSKDDGYVVTSSRLYAINALTGNAIALTPEEIMAEEATVANGAEKIAYSTQAGELYIIDVQISE